MAFNKSFTPGPKDFDFVLQQISYKPERDDAVDFSDCYYNVNQALVAAKGARSPARRSIATWQDAKLAAPIGTTSLDVIVAKIQPTQDRPGRTTTLAQAVDRPQNGDSRRIVVDLPTAFYMAAVQSQARRRRGAVTGPSPDEYFAMAFVTGSPLVECVGPRARRR